MESMGDIIRVGITGQEGFMGTHLCNFLNTQNDKFEIIDIYSSCECHKYNDQSEDVIVIMRKIH